MVPAKVPQDVRNLVIVLNGREEAKVEFSSVWLNYLASSLPKLVNVAVVLLGNEMCSNRQVLSNVCEGHLRHRSASENGADNNEIKF